MNIVPFSKRYPNEFLSRTEENFNLFLEKLKLFYDQTRADIGDGKIARRKLHGRFNYTNELNDLSINQKGITSEEVVIEFNDMIRGCMRHQDPMTAFNIIPSPLLDVVAGTALLNLYMPNVCWDFLSGKLCLFEKKIVRILGQLANWPQADGFVITGGKQALIYAIKNGMGRANFNNLSAISDFVVICSNLAHYSIEHVCHYLGISLENCLRVATHASGEIDIQALEEILSCVVSKNKKIAAIIAVGGGTINLVPDPILLIKQTIDHFVKKADLDYIPYLHVDAVISWAWLAFDKAVDSSWKEHTNPKILAKIEGTLFKLRGIQHADSFAADFHKTGFCPYSAGVFIAKIPTNLSGMNLHQENISKENIRFGEVEAYQSTLENSRSATSIASIWIALRRMGLNGLMQLILYQLEVCEIFKQMIKEKYGDHFEVLNEHSQGWEIVFKIHFGNNLYWDKLQTASLKEQQVYHNTCYLFLNNFWYGALDEEDNRKPIFGFIKSYSRKGKHEKSFPAFLIHPTSLHYDEETINEMLESIVRVKIAFESQYGCSSAEADGEYLQFTPPR